MTEAARVASRIDDDRGSTTETRGLGGLGASIAEELRIIIVGGVAFGVLVAGAGSRLAMFLLRATSPGSVVGVQSDDDFEIGRFTIGGTYNLLALGALVGFIGAGAYRLVRTRLIGPTWFRRVTTGLASGAVVGSILVHADGIDYRVLKPTWFAITLFVTLPALFGTFIGPVVDRVADEGSWTREGRRRWILPTVSVVAFPPMILVLPFAAAIVAALVAVRQVGGIRRARSTMPFGIIVRTLWLGIAALGTAALVNDIIEISRVV